MSSSVSMLCMIIFDYKQVSMGGEKVYNRNRIGRGLGQGKAKGAGKINGLFTFIGVRSFFVEKKYWLLFMGNLLVTCIYVRVIHLL